MQTRAQKEAEVSELRTKLESASSVLIVDYRGLTVTEANDLRGRLRQAGEGQIEYRVAKNRLVKLAATGTASEGLGNYLAGPSALAFTFDEPSTLAKTLVDYAKDNEKFEIKGGLIEGEVVDLDAVREWAKLPSKDELRAMLAGTLQAPLRNLAGTLNALLGNLRNALEQRQKQLDES